MYLSASYMQIGCVVMEAWQLTVFLYLVFCEATGSGATLPDSNQNKLLCFSVPRFCHL